MVVQNKTEYKTILDIFKRSCETLGKNVFGINKPVEILLKEEDARKYLIMDIVPVAYYENGKIYFPSVLLDILISKYRENPEIVKDILGTLVHEYSHHLLNLKEIGEGELRHIDEGISEALKILYSKLVKKCLDNNKESLESIINCTNEKFLNILRDKSEISNLEKEINEEYKLSLEKLKEITQRSLNYCTNQSKPDIKVLDQILELAHGLVYNMAGYSILKKKGINELVKDVSKIAKREEINKLIEEYNNLLLEEIEKLESEGYKIEEAIDCLEKKRDEVIESIFDFEKIINKFISEIELKLKEQEKRINNSLEFQQYKNNGKN